MRRISMVLLLMLGATTVARGDTAILNETFDTYADTGAMQAQWVGADPNLSRIVDNSINPDAFPGPGQGAEHLGGAINVYQNLNGGNAIVPSATQSVQLKVDIFNDATSANKRVSLGMRGPGAANLMELGAWNADTCDPTVSGCVPGTTVAGGPGFEAAAGRGLAHRLQLFGGVSPPLVVQPNWQYYDLPLELDTNANGITSLSEVGPGWHTYTATITPTTVTMEIDLYRDGVRNVSKTPGDGTPGVDAAVTYTITTTAGGFTELRFGGPSGVASSGGSLIFDNIKLSLIDVVTPGNNADFNGDGTVNAADYTIWRDHLGLTGTGTTATGDANGDTNVDTVDYDLWKTGFGTSPGAGTVAAAVPEPSLMALGLISAMWVVAAGARRKS